MLYVVVVLIMTDADAINILTDDNPGITTTAKKEYRYTTYNNTEKVAPGERLHAICRKGAYVLVDKANGNRIAVEKENLDLDVTELPYYNSGFEYYVSPYAGIPLPTFLSRLRIKSRLNYIFSLDKIFGRVDFFDFKVFGLAEVILWEKETSKK